MKHVNSKQVCVENRLVDHQLLVRAKGFGVKLFGGEWQSYPRRSELATISVLTFFDSENCLDEEKVRKTGSILFFSYGKT